MLKKYWLLLINNLLSGCANITGGGISDNIKRVIPDNLCAEIDLQKIKTYKNIQLVKKNIILKTKRC